MSLKIAYPKVTQKSGLQRGPVHPKLELGKLRLGVRVYRFPAI